MHLGTKLREIKFIINAVGSQGLDRIDQQFFIKGNLLNYIREIATHQRFRN